MRRGFGVRVGVAQVPMSNQVAVQYGRVFRYEVAEPGSPRAIVGDSANAWQQLHAARDVSLGYIHLSFMDHGLVESRAATSRLIDDVGWVAFPHEVRKPPFTAVRRCLQARRC